MALETQFIIILEYSRKRKKRNCNFKNKTMGMQIRHRGCYVLSLGLNGQEKWENQKYSMIPKFPITTLITTKQRTTIIITKQTYKQSAIAANGGVVQLIIFGKCDGGMNDKVKMGMDKKSIQIEMDQLLCISTVMNNNFIFLFNNNSPNMQLLTIGPLIIFVIVVLYLVFQAIARKEHNKNRLASYRNLSSQKIEGDKIIIAIQLTEIFVSISSTMSYGYIELEVERNKPIGWFYRIKRWLGWGGVYYRIKDKSYNIDFIQALLDTRKVQLYLYTNQTQPVSAALLKKLGLCKYFKQSHRRYFDPASKDNKHPTQIDSETRRVIILTAKKDYADEDSKYFLIVKRANLKKYGRELSELIKKNEEIDEFHTQFVSWKMDRNGYDSSQQ